MDSEEKSGAVAARVSDEVEPAAGEKPESVADTEVNGHHKRNASMSASFLAAPGYSPSFASLGDTGAFESHHAQRFSDTFEGFEPPPLSESQEVQETPKVTRPEGLSFTTPVASMKIPEEIETTAPGFTTPVAAGDEVQSEEKEGAEDYTSPIANLVESNPAAATPASTPAPVELMPALGNVDSFSFGAVPESPQTPDVFTGANPISDSAPSPSTPTEVVPALGNAASFSFGGAPEASPSTPTELIPALGNVNSFPHVWPPTSTEPHVVSMKIPGHELLESLTTTNQNAVEAVSAPVSSDVKNQVEEPEPVVEVQPKSEDVVTVQPKIHEAAPPPEEAAPLPEEPAPLPEEPAPLPEEPAPLSEEPALAATPSEKLDGQATESPIVLAAAGPPTVQEPVETNNVVEAVAAGEVVQKPVEHETDTVTESKDLPQRTQITTPPETFAFRNVEAGKEVPAPAQATPTPKPGVPFLGTLKSMSTKKFRGPSDEELRSMVVIPDYLSRDMANAVATEGAAAPEGPREGEAAIAPTSPILVFINSRSGGRLGPELMTHFEDLISSNQVYDLSKHSPSAVLRYGVGCLDRMASDGDECARQTRENLRILVAGGDGTVGWCLSSVGALRELSANTSVPPLGIIPLGTGNDLSRSFGWGGEFTSTAKSALKKCLVKALNSSATPLDTWNAVVMPAKSVAAEDIQFPHSMHPQHHVPLPSSVAGEKHEKDETAPAFEGLFFNYLSVGMDAQVAYGFHHLRDEKPWLARSRKANEMIYSSFGCAQGWFCTACSTAPRARAVSNIMQLFVKRRGNASKDWEEIHIPSNIRALVICNLKSYAGGHNPWGKPSSSKRKKEGLEEQRPDDGLLEVMGLKDGWHSAFVLLEVSTAIRLCQAEAVKMEFNGNARKEAFLQMDGEPWMQPMGAPHDEPTVVMIDKLPAPALVLKR